MSGKKRGKRKKKLRILKGILIFFVMILIVFISAISAAILFVNNKMDMVQKVEIDESQISISDNKNLTTYRNIAIFGVDSRSNEYNKNGRSDCIMIASINNRTHDIKLISVYRDTYLQIDEHGLDKITHAYSYGGAPLTIKTLNTNLDLNISEFVTVNFDAVVDMVDALGGIEMNITAEEAKYINQYIDEVNMITNKNSKHITKAGKYTLDGVQAVSYCRIRYTNGGDYKRTERMRDVLALILAKLKTKNVTQINSIADKVLPKVYTNLSTKDLITMIPSVTSFDISKSTGWPYKVDGVTISGVWYGVANTLESNVKQLHEEIFENENYEVPESIKTISNKIKKKAGK